MITHCPHCGKSLTETIVERPFTPEQIARFWKSVRKQENGCWIFEKGGPVYGRLTIGGRMQLAHIVSWKIHRGSIPLGLKVLHNCPNGDTPRCVNPHHLRIGTQSDNVRDMVAKGRNNPVTGTGNHFAKLDADKVLHIRVSLANKTESIATLAQMFDMSFQGVYHVALGRVWASVGGPLIQRTHRPKLDSDELAEMWEMRKSGARQADIAQRFGIHQGSASNLLRRMAQAGGSS